ncbi:hypothetical protein TrLO_g9542 [Triparma laevis f. longispina]|uniref:Uncharacterized protein n=1 Tax=Triparma laevis f. longispina TaxID=1714387 RepID=A0A9W7CDH8_9STRA|nr:hypothetical protein TrLO_g9542 [Triparma laevis f. longispina]
MYNGTQEQIDALRGLVDQQAYAFQVFQAATASKSEEQARKIEEQARKIEEQARNIEEQGRRNERQDLKVGRLEAEVKTLKETHTMTTSSIVQMGDFARRWRFVLFAGGVLPIGLLLGSIKYGDQRFVAASRMFEMFGAVCSLAAAFGNPKDFASKNEKLFIVLCSLTSPATWFVRAYLSLAGSVDFLTWGCIWMLILVPSYLAVAKFYSKFSNLKLGATITTVFKALPGVIGSMLYISASSMQCIMNSKPEDELDVDGFIKRCRNPSAPTFMVSAFLFMSWMLTYVIPPLLPSNRALTWGDVMKLNMNRMEGLQFTLFCTLSMEALVVFSLTDNQGGGANDFLDGLMWIMFFNFFVLFLVVAYEHLLKPLICKPSSRTAASSSATSPDDFFDNYINDLSINAL